MIDKKKIGIVIIFLVIFTALNIVLNKITIKNTEEKIISHVNKEILKVDNNKQNKKINIHDYSQDIEVILQNIEKLSVKMQKMSNSIKNLSKSTEENKKEFVQMKKDALNINQVAVENIEEQINDWQSMIVDKSNEDKREIVQKLDSNIDKIESKIQLLNLKINYLNENNKKEKKQIATDTEGSKKKTNNNEQPPDFYLQGVMTGDKNIAFISETKNTDPYSVSVGDILNYNWVIRKIEKDRMQLQSKKTKKKIWVEKGE